MNNLYFRRELRRNATAAEVILWQALRMKQVQGRKFRRQHSLGKYVVDFFCAEEYLVIEVDGSFHTTRAITESDHVRDLWLAQQKLKVLRFQNKEIYDHVERVVWEIENAFGWWRI